MSSCTACGHQLGVGRFCTGCGAPVGPPSADQPTPVSSPPAPPAPFGGDWRTDTAERSLPRTTATDPRTPPSVIAPPPPPRYPLYADEVDGYAPVGPLTTQAEPAPAAALPPDDPEPADDDYLSPHYDYDYSEERRSPVLWILATVLVLALVATGWWFLVRSDGAGSATDDDGPSSQTGAAPTELPGTDVARRASAKAPSTAPPNQDVDGHQVSYDASNMLDGVPTTTWRTAGDATGTELTFTLPEPTELVQVGMINGYAKKATKPDGRVFDWYRGNRRVDAAVWVFDDGTKVRQQLGEDPRMQLLSLDRPVTTTTVVLRLVRVSAPGEGDAGRDFTAVSEVSLISPASDG